MGAHMPNARRKPTAAVPEAPRKRRISLSVRGDLIECARTAGINLSEFAEKALIEKLREIERDRWREENRAAIKHFNARIERDGPLNADLLAF